MLRHSLRIILYALAVSQLIASCRGMHKGEALQDSSAISQRPGGDPASTDSLTDSLDQDVLFAFTDSSGSYLVGATDSLAHGPYYLITPGGDSIELQYLGWRLERRQSTGRQTASNFQNTGGSLFFLKSRKLAPDQTYQVVSGRFLSTHRPLRLTRNDYPPIDSITNAGISRSRGRAIQQSWKLGSIDGVGSLNVVLFEDKRRPLASLVLVRTEGFVFHDYPGDTSAEGSVWRVDDGGEFPGANINVIAAFQSSYGIELTTTWAGSEGESAEFLQQSSDRFVSVKEGYRYWVPN